MRYTILFSVFLLFLFVGCKKNKFATTPSLKFESVNTTQLHNHDIIRFTLSFTDAEGDFSDTSTLYVFEDAANCSQNNPPASLKLPPFPTSKDQKGTIDVTFGYNPPTNNIQSLSRLCSPENDTAVFRFVLKDNADHLSDTASSPTIIIYN